jgi:tight adherence protein C
MNISSIGIIIAAAIILFGLLISAASFRFISNKVSSRLQVFVAPSEAGASFNEAKTIPEKFQGSLFSRTIVQMFRNIIAFLGKFASQASFAELDRKLSVARNPLKMRALEFSGLRIILILVGVVLALLLYLGGKYPNNLNIIGGIGIILFAILLPSAWLDSLVRKAQDEARAGLPDALDMLSVCTFAGLGFDQSLQRVTEYWQTTLGYELKRVVNEMELGISRADALRNLSNRLRISELSSFVAIIIQADSLGMRIADVLHEQAEQMRILRQFRAKEIANRLPAKMIVPLAIFILPALLAVIFAPVIPSLLTLFGNF